MLLCLLVIKLNKMKKCLFRGNYGRQKRGMLGQFRTMQPDGVKPRTLK
jgi:hypothetical protein